MEMICFPMLFLIVSPYYIYLHIKSYIRYIYSIYIYIVSFLFVLAKETHPLGDETRQSVRLSNLICANAVIWMILDGNP